MNQWLEELDASGVEVKAIRSRPELYEDAQFYWEAFLDLDGTRQAGFAGCPIQFQEIQAWLDLNQISDMIERRNVVTAVRVLDRILCKHFAKEMKSHGSPRTNNPVK